MLHSKQLIDCLCFAFYRLLNYAFFLCGELVYIMGLWNGRVCVCVCVCVLVCSHTHTHTHTHVHGCVQMFVSLMSAAAVNDSISLDLNALVTMMGHFTGESAASAPPAIALAGHQKAQTHTLQACTHTRTRTHARTCPHTMHIRARTLADKDKAVRLQRLQTT